MITEVLLCCNFLARDAFVGMNCRAVSIMFVRLSVCLSVWDGRAHGAC